MIRRVRQELSAQLGSIGRPGISTFVSWGCAALAYPLATRGGYAGSVGAALVFTLAVLFLAYLLGSGVLAFAADAKRTCLPGWQRLARRANLLAAVLLLPPLALTIAALAGNPVWPAWIPAVLVLAIAVAGLLAPRRPVSAAGVLLLVVLAACWAASGRGGHERGKAWLFGLLAVAMVLVPAAVTLLAAVKWRRLIRGDSSQRGALEHAPGSTSSPQGPSGRRPPVHIVRACLGGMFAQHSFQLITGAVLLALFILAAVGLPWLGASGMRWVVIALALVAAGLISSGFLTRFARLTRGQLAELALMPGLGAPAAQRRALYRAALTPPLLWFGAVLLLGAADLLLKGEPLSGVGMLAVCLFIMWLSYAVFALQKLTTLPPKRQSFISELMLLYIMVYTSGVYYWLYTTNSQLRPWVWFWITPVLVGVGIASAIAISVRRLATAPHPFLARATVPR